MTLNWLKDDKQKDYERYEREQEKRNEERRQKLKIVAEAEARLELKRSKFEADNTSEHANDFEAFDFKCERVGDFLSLSVTRLARFAPSVIDTDRSTVRPHTISANLNLTLVTDITLTGGQGPNWKEVASFYVHVDEGKADLYGQGPTPGARQSYTPPKDKSDQHHGGFGLFYHGDLIVPGQMMMPQPAQDDVVTFRGLGASVHCPFGRGKEVLAAVMTAIAEETK